MARKKKEEKIAEKLVPIKAFKVPNFQNAWIVCANLEQKSAAWPIIDANNKPVFLIAPPNGEWRVVFLAQNEKFFYPQKLLPIDNLEYFADIDLFVATDKNQIVIISKNDKVFEKFGVNPKYNVNEVKIYIGKCENVDIAKNEDIIGRLTKISEIRDKKKKGLRDFV